MSENGPSDEGKAGGYSLDSTVIIPSRNEAKDLSAVISGIWAMRPRTAQLKFLVLDDASTDLTPSMLEELSAEVPLRIIRHPESVGFGGALARGIQEADTPWLLFVDADAQYDAEDVKRFLTMPRDIPMLVSGWRVRRADPFVRIFISIVFQTMNRLGFGLRMKDITSSLKLMPSAPAKEIARRVRYMNGSFWSEFMVRWKTAGYTWTEVPIRHYPRRDSKSKVFAPGHLGRLLVHQGVGFLRLLREVSVAPATQNAVPAHLGPGTVR